MKKLFTLLLFAIAFQSATHAQVTLTPGKGIGNATLGMPISSINALIGKPISVTAYADEAAKWKRSSYDLKKELLFQIGFDKVYVYDSKNPMAIWKVYTVKDRAVIFSINSFMADTAVVSNISMPNGLRFLTDSTTMLKAMGNDCIKVNSRYKNAPPPTADAPVDDSEMEYIYRKKGVCFLVLDGQLTNAFIFKPVARR